MARKIKKDRNELKILTLGLDNSGKTTILHRQFSTSSMPVSPTFGYQVRSVLYESTSLVIMDVGGQSSFRKYWSNYYEKLDGLIYVFDLTDTRPFHKYIEDILSDAYLVDVPVLILGNKSDLCPSPQQVRKLLTDAIRSRENTYFSTCSGKTGENLEEAFGWLITAAKNTLYAVR